MIEKQNIEMMYESNLREGNVVEGKIKSIQPYGAFVEVKDGLVGLLHIENISVARIKHPSERFEIGQKLNVVVKSIEESTGRITLSYKELLRNMARKCGIVP